MSLRLDSSSPGMRVRDICFHLGGTRGPCLREWVTPEQFRDFERRCQSVIHAREYHREVDEADCDIGALVLRCSGDTFLSAASAVLAAANPEPGSDDEDDDLDVLIRMVGLSKLWVPWAGRAHGARRSRQPAASCRLQPINEVSLDE